MYTGGGVTRGYSEGIEVTLNTSGCEIVSKKKYFVKTVKSVGEVEVGTKPLIKNAHKVRTAPSELHNNLRKTGFQAIK